MMPVEAGSSHVADNHIDPRHDGIEARWFSGARIAPARAHQSRTIGRGNPVRRALQDFVHDGIARSETLHACARQCTPSRYALGPPRITRGRWAKEGRNRTTPRPKGGATILKTVRPPARITSNV